MSPMTEFAVGFTSLLLMGVFLYFIPIRMAKAEITRKGLSKHWLWFAVHPIGGWTVWAIVKWLAKGSPCPSCGARLRPNDRFCSRCKAAVSETAMSTAQSTPAAINWATGKANCLACGSPVRLLGAACSHCGVAVPKVRCPLCASSKTELSRPKVAMIGSIILITGPLLRFNMLTQPRRSSYGYYTPPALTGGDLIEFGTLAAMFIFGLVGLIRFFTRRSFAIRCAACGKTSKPGMAPKLVATEPAS